MNKKELVVKYRALVSLACSVHNLPNLLRRRVKGEGNRVSVPCGLLKKVHIDIRGKNNTLTIGDFCQLSGASIAISGDNNHVVIGPWSILHGTDICIEDSGSKIHIGPGCRFLGRVELAAIEGTRITIGGDCLFSGDVHIRTGDSHSVLNLGGQRINPSEDVAIGDHVWVGSRVTCLKGAQIPDHSIVGACALVTGKFEEPNCVLAGVPAKVVKRGVDWDITRIPMEDAKGQVDG